MKKSEVDNIAIGLNYIDPPSTRYLPGGDVLVWYVEDNPTAQFNLVHLKAILTSGKFYGSIDEMVECMRLHFDVTEGLAEELKTEAAIKGVQKAGGAMGDIYMNPRSHQIMMFNGDDWVTVT